MALLRKRLFALLFVVGLAGPTASCIIVDDGCDDGSLSCDGEVIQECVGGDWRVLEDCWSLCGGVCDFDAYGEPVCIC